MVAKKKGVSFHEDVEGNSERPSLAPSLRMGHSGSNQRQTEKQLAISRHLFLPWSLKYEIWWTTTVLLSFFTVYFESYVLAFGEAGFTSNNKGSNVVEQLLTTVFVIDMLVQFNTAYYQDDLLVCDRKQIAKKYFSKMFWIDLIGVLPFTAIFLNAGDGSEDTAQFIALLRLLRLVRLHRVFTYLENLNYSTKISFLALTLVRNFVYVMSWTHLAACLFYYIARHFDFLEDDTWINAMALENDFERYVTSLYWSITTFTTVGYGDFSPVSSAGQIFCMVYMILNIIGQSYIIGSITLLVVKNDETTREYRDTLQMLDSYTDVNDFGMEFNKGLRTQLKLEFNNREVSDEKVLEHFPRSIRRKVLRKLYLPSLMHTDLMRGIIQHHFIDEFLNACSVELFSPGEEILELGNISSDLYLLVAGQVTSMAESSKDFKGKAMTASTMSESDFNPGQVSARGKSLFAGTFLNEIGFFTESPESNTVRTVTPCKTLTMSRAAYKLLAQDYPGSGRKILENLLDKVETLSADLAEGNNHPDIDTDVDLEGSDSARSAEVRQVVAAVQTKTALASVKGLVEMHIGKQKDDHTTRFLFAASRGDNKTISQMCDQGFDPNSSDYDSRSAMMVAAMKGNKEVVEKLLEYGADPNLTDMHGSTALYESAKNGHESTMEVLLSKGGELCMDESLAASTLCQAVYDGDVLTLRRLLKAKIQVNAADYDKRSAAMIASAEGNVAALRVLVEFGADLTLKDRWNNTVADEAKKNNFKLVLDFLETLK